jgi:thiamine pyrophosphate-dependent acetolactate synthase large subunit-like protein
MHGADAILRSLEAEGVTVCFGIPGGALLPLYDALARGARLRHVLARHEQGAGHMAEGYARASGEVGVVWATSGPGATNLVTPLASAFLDAVPLVAVTGQVATALIGTDAFQECDIAGVAAPLVKHVFAVRRATEIPQTLAAAFRLAPTEPCGPVLVDVPRDVQLAELDFEYPRRTAARPSLAGVTTAPRRRAGVGTAPESVVTALGQLTGGRDLVWVVGAGGVTLALAQRLRCDRPGSFLVSDGLDPRGFALPAALGAKAARPQATVVCIEEAEGFALAARELATSVLEGLPVVVVVVDDTGPERPQPAPDCAVLARAYGVHGVTVGDERELEDILTAALDCEQTVVVDARLARTASRPGLSDPKADPLDP